MGIAAGQTPNPNQYQYPFQNPSLSIEERVSNARNTGKRVGEEVVQLYVKHVGSKVERSIKELKGFQRVALKASETKSVQMTLQAKDLAYWDVQKKQWVVEDDTVNLMLGASSADVRVQKTIRVNNAGM
jgi:beta-glucosidase